HFAPQQLLPAFEIYGAGYSPPAKLPKPAVMAGVIIFAAETDAKARRPATTQQLPFTDLFRGTRGLGRPPIDDIETYWTPMEKARVEDMLTRFIVGSEATVGTGVRALVDETNADELIIVSDIYEHRKRLRSFEIIAQAHSV